MTDDVKLWELYPEIWKTESAFLSWIRGGVRQSLWNRHPVKLEFIKRNRIRIPNPNPKGKVNEVWGGVCSLTGEVCTQNNLEVDHIKGNHSLRSIDDIAKFIKGIVLVTIDDLCFVSKEAHKCKSYAEKHGISFEDAVVEKKAIAAVKLPLVEQRRRLLEAGFDESSIKTAAKRKECFRKLYGGL